MEHTTNSVTLRGTLHTLPEFSHENHGKRFFRFLLEVPRLSGAVDILPVIAREEAVNRIDPSGGSMITVIGQIRSHNQRTDGTRRLLIFVFAGELMAEEGEPINDVVLEGALCRDPVYRRTPLGREICDVMLAVPRRYHRTDYIPCILWGRTAQETAQLPVGSRLELHGRLQSRNYLKVLEDRTEERTAYEVSVMDAFLLTEQPV